jgi:phosphatidylglycerophosphatase A
MFKIYPVNKFEHLQGSRGVMLDDFFAGVYTNLTMQAATRLAGIA